MRHFGQDWRWAIGDFVPDFSASLLTSAGKVAGNWYTPGAAGKVVPDYPGAEY